MRACFSRPNRTLERGRFGRYDDVDPPALRVAPGAGRSEVVGRHGDAWKVRVTAAPEGGNANDAVVRLVAATLGLPRRDVEIVSGQTARDKVVAVAGLELNETERRLAEAVGANAVGKDTH